MGERTHYGGTVFAVSVGTDAVAFFYEEVTVKYSKFGNGF
jgi:hypothetical protein